MVMTDPIADMLSRIRNGYLAGKKSVRVPYSEVKFEIVKILAEENFIGKIEKKGKSVAETELKLNLIYHNGEPAVSGLVRVSKPGLRVYRRSGKIPYIRTGSGVTIISTSQGLITDREARKKNLGGELICQVWY